MGSGSATGKKFQVRFVHSLLKYFFKFQLWYWIKNLHYQIFKFVIDNSDISLNCLQHIQKRRNFDAKVTCHQPICLLLHAILSGVGVPWAMGHQRFYLQFEGDPLACFDQTWYDIHPRAMIVILLWSRKKKSLGASSTSIYRETSFSFKCFSYQGLICYQGLIFYRCNEGLRG